MEFFLSTRAPTHPRVESGAFGQTADHPAAKSPVPTAQDYHGQPDYSGASDDSF